MTESKQPSSKLGKRKQNLPSWLLWLLGTTVETQQPQPQSTQPDAGHLHAVTTPEIDHALEALEAALAQGGEAHDIHTAFTDLSLAERQAQWHTQEPLSQAEQMAVWEQGMEGLLAPYRTDPSLADG